MDSTAIAMCMDNSLPISVVNVWAEGCVGEGCQGGTGRYCFLRLCHILTPAPATDLKIFLAEMCSFANANTKNLQTSNFVFICSEPLLKWQTNQRTEAAKELYPDVRLSSAFIS